VEKDVRQNTSVSDVYCQAQKEELQCNRKTSLVTVQWLCWAAYTLSKNHAFYQACFCNTDYTEQAESCGTAGPAQLSGAFASMGTRRWNTET